MSRLKLLFICSRNEIRSLTAEQLFGSMPDYAAKSAGTSPQARIRVNAGHIGWADLIFVMEKEHKHILEENFREELQGKRVISLQIQDVFRYMEPALIDELKAGVGLYLELPD